MTNLEAVFNQYRGKRVLLDANLLLLFLIGSYERSRIARFKRTAGFSESDFDILAGLMTAFRAMVTTPHVLTEVSNLANSLPEHLKPSWSEHFALQTASLTELFEPAVEVMLQESFLAFGLTDAAIHCASIDTLILTEDFRLSGFLISRGVAVLNFKELLLFAQ
jgi:hypothetical protein